jgi:tRNA (adenine22-N1)-methyltransferase
VDPSQDVIKVLKEKVTASYITKKELIKIHMKRGQDVILGPNSKTVFIAGIGGKEIGEIIQNLIPQLTPADRLVISPHRNILELRQYLNSTELGLVNEVVIKEEGQFYQILCLVKSSEYPSVPLYGTKLWQGAMGVEYRGHQIRTFGIHQDDLSKAYIAYLTQITN